VPWEGWVSTDMSWCEGRLDGWVREPHNTATNFAYLAVGAYLVWRAQRDERRDLAPLGLIAIAVGIGSAFYHASATYAGEVVDVGAMLLLSSFVIDRNLARVGRAPIFRWLLPLSVALLVLVKSSGIFVFAAHAIFAGALEVRLMRRYREGISRRPLFLLLLSFAIAWGAWWLDYLRVLCAPAQHALHGHGVWHLVNSLCFVFLYRFYRQLSPRERPAR